MSKVGKKLKGFITNPGLTYKEVAPVMYTVASGAAGWVDTDISASVGTTSGIVFIKIGTGNNLQVVGARDTSSSVDTSFTYQDGGSAVGYGGTVISKYTNGTVSLWRNAVANCYYSVMGYWA